MNARWQRREYWWAWIFTRELECVLDSSALVAGVTTLGDLGVIVFIQEGQYVIAIRNPDIDDRNLGVNRTLSDEFSFDHSSIQSESDWEQLTARYLSEAAALSDMIEQLPEETIWSDFTDEKYGSYYRNLHGIVEHTHYHLGQISLVKKMLVS